MRLLPTKKVSFFLLFIIGMLLITLFFTQRFSYQGDGDLAYHAGNRYFEDQRYRKAKASYLEALQADPNLAPAYAGLANTLVQLKDYEEALRFIEEAIEIDPKFGGYYAIRGIVHDHLGQYQRAISDYEKSQFMMPDVSRGMGWFDRFFQKQARKPATIQDRLSYLKAQMKLPKHKRLLKVPQIDGQQVPHQQ